MLLPFSKAISLAYYRAYVLHQDGRIRKAIELHCADDAAALEEAQQYVDSHDVELWQLKRRVGLLKRPN